MTARSSGPWASALTFSPLVPSWYLAICIRVMDPCSTWQNGHHLGWRAKGLLRACGYKARWGQSHQGPSNSPSICSLRCLPLWALGSERDEYLIVFI